MLYSNFKRKKQAPFSLAEPKFVVKYTRYLSSRLPKQTIIVIVFIKIGFTHIHVLPVCIMIGGG